MWRVRGWWGCVSRYESVWVVVYEGFYYEGVYECVWVSVYEWLFYEGVYEGVYGGYIWGYFEDVWEGGYYEGVRGFVGEYVYKGVYVGVWEMCMRVWIKVSMKVCENVWAHRKVFFPLMIISKINVKWFLDFFLWKLHSLDKYFKCLRYIFLNSKDEPGEDKNWSTIFFLVL